jgi:hypothetical protein
MLVTNAEISASATTPAETVIARNARDGTEKNGLKTGNRTASCALFYTFNCIRDTLRLIHVVFTLPEVLNKTALHEPKMLYDILFESAWETLQTFGKNKNLQMGMIAVLHTWGQNLSLHPHLHCIVPGGGVDENGAWKNIKKTVNFCFR